MYSLNLGLRSGGGIGDTMALLELDDPKYGYKLIFDISYFMLVNIVSLNIIFGIIIDTFAELRDAQNTRDDDLINMCFICGYGRDVFEKEGLSFDKHIRFEHNPIQYINFLIYLRQKPSDEFDGTEEFVYTQYIKRKTNWVPIGNTNFIKVEEDDDTDAKVDNLNDAMEKQVERQDKVKELFADINKEMTYATKKVQNLTRDSRIIRKKTRNLGDANSANSSISNSRAGPGLRLQPTVPRK